MRHGTRQSVLFEGVFRKAVRVDFDGPSQSSDGGVLLLAAVDGKFGLTEALTEELRDQRDWRKVRHDHLEILRQRVYSIALSYADCNDSARIGDDPARKLACDRSSKDGERLASQPTLSRFVNAPSGRELVAVGRKLERIVIERLKRNHPKAWQSSLVRGRPVRQALAGRCVPRSGLGPASRSRKDAVGPFGRGCRDAVLAAERFRVAGQGSTTISLRTCRGEY